MGTTEGLLYGRSLLVRASPGCLGIAVRAGDTIRTPSGREYVYAGLDDAGRVRVRESSAPYGVAIFERGLKIITLSGVTGAGRDGQTLTAGDEVRSARNESARYLYLGTRNDRDVVVFTRISEEQDNFTGRLFEVPEPRILYRENKETPMTDTTVRAYRDGRALVPGDVIEKTKGRRAGKTRVFEAVRDGRVYVSGNRNGEQQFLDSPADWDITVGDMNGYAVTLDGRPAVPGGTLTGPLGTVYTLRGVTSAGGLDLTYTSPDGRVLATEGFASAFTGLTVGREDGRDPQNGYSLRSDLEGAAERWSCDGRNGTGTDIYADTGGGEVQRCRITGISAGGVISLSRGGTDYSVRIDKIPSVDLWKDGVKVTDPAITVTPAAEQPEPDFPGGSLIRSGDIIAALAWYAARDTAGTPVTVTVPSLTLPDGTVVENATVTAPAPSGLTAAQRDAFRDLRDADVQGRGRYGTRVWEQGITLRDSDDFDDELIRELLEGESYIKVEELPDWLYESIDFDTAARRYTAQLGTAVELGGSLYFIDPLSR